MVYKHGDKVIWDRDDDKTYMRSYQDLYVLAELMAMVTGFRFVTRPDPHKDDPSRNSHVLFREDYLIETEQFLKQKK